MDGDDPPVHALGARRQDALDGHEGDRPLDDSDDRRSLALADPLGGSGSDDRLSLVLDDRRAADGHPLVVRGVLRRHLHADLVAAAPPGARCVRHLAVALPIAALLFGVLLIAELPIGVLPIGVLLIGVLLIAVHRIVGNCPSGVLPGLDAQVAWAWPIADIVVRS